nr:hypothetical protein [Tanacetum cinerariifolium]
MDINIDALYNILKQKQGDVNDALGYKKKAVVVTSDPLALVTEKIKASKQKEKVKLQTEFEGSDDDDISDLKKITALLTKAFNQNKYYAKPTNNNLRTSSTSSSINKKPKYVKSIETKEDKKVDEKKRDMSKVKCYNCKKECHFSKDCKKAKAKTTTTIRQRSIAEVAYYTSESECESEYETSEYYDNSTNYGLFVNENNDQEIFHDAIKSASENFIKNHIDPQKDYDKFEKRIEKANQQSKDLENQNKDLQAKIRVFVGYSKESASFRIYNKQTRKIHESINVNFDEISKMASKQFSLEPGLSNLNKTEKSSNPSVSQVSETSKKDLQDLFQKFYDEYFDSSKIMKSSTTNVETSNVKIPLNEEEVFHESSESFQEGSSSSSLNDDIHQSLEEFTVPSSNTQLTKDHPLHKIIGDPKSSVRTRGQLANSCLFSCLLSSIELANVADALRDADWVSAMFVPVARIEAIRLFLAYAAHKDFTVFQMGVKTTFLNGILKEEVYIGEPLGSVSTQYPNHVYALDKALYGLKQAPRTWYDVLSQFGVENCDTVPTPMVEQAKLKLDLIRKRVDHTDYHSMIGSLMYVTSSRPDIMFATCMCARYQANPNEHHVSAVKRIFVISKGLLI